MTSVGRPHPGRGPAWRNRLITAGLVAAFLTLTRWMRLDPVERADFTVHFVLTLGYGHLIGAAVFARRRRAEQWAACTARPLRLAFASVSLLTAWVLYSWGLERHPVLLPLLFAIAAYHTVENDLMLERAYAGRLRLGPLPRTLSHHLGAVALTGLLLLAGIGAAGADPMAAPRDGLVDLFGATTLYHLISWLVLFADRARRERATRSAPHDRHLWRSLAWCHAAPGLVCGAVWAAPDGPMASLSGLVFSPGLYLFWSVLHVVHTAWARGLAPRSAPV